MQLESHTNSSPLNREVLSGGDMKVRLRGPYMYKNNLRRSNVSFKNEGETIVFDSRREMMMNEENSANFDERFWVINPVLPGIGKQVRIIVLDKIPFSRMAEPIVFNTVNILLDQYKERLIVKRSPRQILNGKKVDLLDFLNNMADRFGLKSLIPPGPPENTFGLVHFQNMTTDSMELFTGVGKTKGRFAEVISWNHNNKVKFWKGKCQIINGTNGELYKPFINLGKPIRVFLPQLCRTFDLDPVGDLVEIQDGLKALEYEVSPRLYLGARNNPSNKCFCSNLRSYDCQFDGLVNMGPCFFDVPIYLTRANLKSTDDRIKGTIDESAYKDKLPDKQSFYLDPTTGTVLKVNLTLASVIKLERQPYLRDMAAIRNLTYAPVFVTNESLDLPFEFAWQILALQYFTTYYREMYALMAGGGVGLLLIKVFFFR